MLRFKCRFFMEGVCGKRKEELGYKLKTKGEEVFGKCKFDKTDTQELCMFYEHPKNVILLDEVRQKNMVKFKDGVYDFCSVREGKSYNPRTKKKEEVYLYPNVEKETVWELLSSYKNYKEFYILGGAVHNTTLIKFNNWLRKSQIFEVGDMEAPTTILRIANICNSCAFCLNCKEWIKVKYSVDEENTHKKAQCSKCGNIRLKRKFFLRQFTQCPQCKSKDFCVNKKWMVQHFVITKSAFNM